MRNRTIRARQEGKNKINREKQEEIIKRRREVVQEKRKTLENKNSNKKEKEIEKAIK